MRRDSWSGCLTLHLQGGALEWHWGPVFGRSRTGWEISAGDLTADDWRVVDAAAVVGGGMRDVGETEATAPAGTGRV